MTLRLGLLGAGTVGTALAQLLSQREDLHVKITKALVRDVDKPRPGLPAELLTVDPDVVVAESDILVEVMGGVKLAAGLMQKALADGKHVVTANKAVLAERWEDFQPYMHQGLLHFEAAVMAGTPVIGPLTASLRGSRPLELHAILNGTCNYMLSELEKGVSYQAALAEAQRLGYAEADPSLDVGGFDAAHKLTVLARLVFDPMTRWEDVKQATRGIESLTPEAMQEADARGAKIRLVASIYPAQGRWKMSVRPVYLPFEHPMARAASNLNALYYRGDAIGEVFISGAGAGGQATASGVLADIIAAAQGISGPTLLAHPVPMPSEHELHVLEEVRL